MNSPPDLLNVTVRITRIRSLSRNGCIAFGHRVDLDSGLNDRASAIVVHVPANIASPASIVVGAIFEAYGQASTTRREHDGYVVTETNLHVQDIRQVRPSGSQLIQWLADNVPGIREVKATKLWDALGERLYEALDNEANELIRPIIPSDEIRQGLFTRWAENGDAKTLRFVQDKSIPLDLARKVIKFHRRGTIDALIDDPYRLLSFSGRWKQVDTLARDNFAIKLDDPRRLAAALEEAIYRISEQGHTCARLNDLHPTVSRLLLPHSAPKTAMVQALRQGGDKGQFIMREAADGELMLHAPGAYLMERQCAEFINSLLSNPVCQQQIFPVDIDGIISDFEDQERVLLGIPEFSLNAAQREAVKSSFSNRFSIITGGAGVGKTTVLKALYKALDTLGRPRFQMALSGRATARMIEATQETAWTIAGFLKRVDSRELGDEPVIVIDEASMLDVLTFYRLTTKLPLGAHMILVGDPYQLPPIAAGLILHVLCDLPNVPTVRLTEVKRQAKESLIPRAALAVRDGLWPEFSSNSTAEVAFISCPDEQIISTVMRLYDADREATQILGATKSCKFAGVETINQACHAAYAAGSKPLLLRNTETGEVEFTGFCEGDLLLYTANDWQRNLQNGCLGQLTEVFDAPCQVNIGDEDLKVMRTAIGRASFEGAEQYILETDVDHIDHAYAITVHKAQGSQFKRVIVPVRRSRVLDRTFVYTALTRAQVQVILIGCPKAVRAAVSDPPRAFSRQVALMQLVAGGTSCSPQSELAGIER